MTTRQQIEEVLAEFEGERISDALINDICSAIYGPVFEPKIGQVICAFGINGSVYGPFAGMQGDRYLMKNHISSCFRKARPLNSEELGE